MKEYDLVKHAFLAVSQRSAWIHLILASKMTLIGPEGTQATHLKQEVIFVSDWLRQGGAARFLLPAFHSSSFHQQLILLWPNISKVEIIHVLWH